ncbi:MAG TPA: DUF3352 domain-containing protein [Candidatus Limnocylindrales bacterium]|nr:DUF3352 domain-containing protein [Candidatus Limnocylindrales bacterium]
MTDRDSDQPAPAPAEPVARTHAQDGAPTTAGGASHDAPTVVWTAPRRDPVEDLTPAHAAPVVTSRRGSALRWAVALLVTVLVVGGAFAGVFLLTGQSAPSGVAGYVARDAIVYADVRLDLPGDQRQRVGELLSKFPGFADQSILDAKIDDVFDRVVRAATRDEQTWTNDIKPWFGGEIGFAFSQLPDPSHPSNIRGLFVITVTDAAKARAWLETVTTKSRTATTRESYNGTDLVVAGDAATKFAYGVTDKVILLGDVGSVKAGVDTKGNGEFGRSGGPRAAADAFDGDTVGYMFMDTRRYIDWAMTMSPQASPGAFPFDSSLRDMLPEWVAGRVRARADGLAFESVAPATTSKVSRENRLSAIAPHLPPSTIAILEGHDVGTGIIEAVDLYRKSASTAEAMKSVDQAAGVLGGMDAIVGWMDQASIVVTRDGSSVGGGAVFTATDRAAGERLLTTLRSYAVLAGGQIGVKVTDSQYAGVTVTTVDFGDLRDLAQMANLQGLPTTGRFTISYASTPDVIAIGVGDAFVRSVLDAKPGSSLADDARYKSMLDGAGPRNVGSMWVDLKAVRELVETAAASSGASLAAYNRDVKPYLEHLDGFVETATTDGNLNRATMVLVVR